MITLIALITGELLGVLFWHHYGWWVHKTENPDDDTLIQFVVGLNTRTLGRVVDMAQQELRRRDLA